MTVPRRARFGRMHPDTIAPETQSVTVSVNGDAAQAFNVAPSSPGCSTGSSGTTCRLSVSAPIGVDGFTVSTYSGTNGAGALLDRGSLTAQVAIGQANALTIVLGPVVSTTADAGPGSLRYAVANASRGDTILFVVPSSATITVTSPIAVPNGITISGPGGVTISGAGASQIFTVPSGVTATISGLILTQGVAKNVHTPGGAIYNLGTLTLVADTFAGNTSQAQSPLAVKRHRVKKSKWRLPEIKVAHGCAQVYYQGGAVYNDGTLTVTNSTFDSNALGNNFFNGNCQYSEGGALYNDVDATLSVTGSTFKNNEAYQGGAVFNNASTHAASFSGDTFSGNLGCNSVAFGCATTGCTGNSCTSEAVGFGAAIFDNDGPGVVIDSSTFASNVAGGGGGPNSASAGGGGALNLVAGQPTITNSSFSNNVAGGGTTNCSDGSGGAINADVPLIVTGDTFAANAASGDYAGFGGAISDQSAAVTGKNDTFTANSATGSGGTACINQAAGVGGAVVGAVANFSSSTFSHNSATAGVTCFGGAVLAATPSSLTGDSFDHNQCTATGNSDMAYGGAVYDDDVLTVSLSTFASNAAVVNGSSAVEARGGALFGNANIHSQNDTFSSNLVEVTGAAGAARGGAAYGPGFFSTKDTFTANTSQATANAYGGALDVTSVIDAEHCTFSSNDVLASVAQGGALFRESSAGYGYILDSSFASNAAGTGTQSGLGGAFADDGGSTVDGATFTQNTATARGGAIDDAGGETISGITATGNTVTAAGTSGVTTAGGGALYSSAATSVADSTISGNTVTVTSGSTAGGGGIYESGTLTMTGSTLASNAVTGSGSTGSGGGALFFSGNGNLYNDTIAQNSSALSGGGVQTIGGAFPALFNVTVDGNHATGKGGNIENGSGAEVEIANTIIASGTASAGSDIETTGATLLDAGYNISTTTPDGGTLSATGDLPNTDPLLSPLANNGGPTETMADSAASPGAGFINFSGSGSGSTCGNVSGINASVDQRGYARGQHNAGCDVGAYEYWGVAPALRVHRAARQRGHAIGGGRAR